MPTPTAAPPLLQRRACFNCRSNKLRCVPLDEVDGSVCRRCQRKSLDCVYGSRKRGRKPGDSSARQNLNQGSMGVHGMAGLKTSNPQSLEGDHLGNGRQSSPHIATGPSRPLGDDLTLFHKFRAHTQWETSRYPSPSLESTGDQDADFTSGTPHASSSLQDPVSLGALSLAEAMFLFDRFIYIVAPPSELFDPQFHTFSVVRRSSSALFTSVLFASSKYYQPHLTKLLLNHAEHLISRAIMQGEANVELVQALHILVYWHSTLDRSAYIKTGLAVRIGHQIRLGRPPRKGHMTDVEARQRLNEERTMSSTAKLERIYSAIFGLPSAVPLGAGWENFHSIEIAFWESEHPDILMDSDRQQAFIKQFVSALDVGILLPGGWKDPPPRYTLLPLIKNAEASLQSAIQSRRFGGLALAMAESTCTSFILRMRCLLLQTTDNAHNANHVSPTLKDEDRAETLQMLETHVTGLCLLINHTHAAYFSDFTLLEIAVPCVQLCRVRDRFSPQEAGRISHAFGQVREAFAQLPANLESSGARLPDVYAGDYVRRQFARGERTFAKLAAATDQTDELDINLWPNELQDPSLNGLEWPTWDLFSFLASLDNQGPNEAHRADTLFPLPEPSHG